MLTSPLFARDAHAAEDASVRQTACASPETIARLAPSGTLRAAINLGNPILANLDPTTKKPAGVSIDLADGLAARLGVHVALVVVDAAQKAVEAVTRDEADVGFFAIDPIRGAGIEFTAPYLLIEGAYAVAIASPITSNDEVDREGTKVVVGRGSAYDLYLSRELKHAGIIRAPTSPDVVDTFLAQHADVAAGVRQQLEADAQRVGGIRVLAGRFMVIRQAMGTSRARGAEAADCVRAYVEEVKANGVVRDALTRHRIDGASVARPGES